MSKPALSQVPDRGPQPLVGRAEPGITPRSLHSCGLHAAAPIGTARLSEQTPPLPPALPRQRATLLEVAADPQHLGAEIGFLAILHTWGQNLLLHPHLHCLVPVGGLSPDHHRWVQPRYRFFLPVGVLKKVFRGKFLEGLKRAYRRNKLSLGGATAPLKDPKAFRALLQSLHRKNW